MRRKLHTIHQTYENTNAGLFDTRAHQMTVYQCIGGVGITTLQDIKV